MKDDKVEKKKQTNTIHSSIISENYMRIRYYITEATKFTLNDGTDN